MWFKSIWLHYWNLLIFQPWKWPSNDAASGISVSPLYNIWRPFSLLFPDSRTVSAGWETLFVATWVTVQINHALAGGIDLLRPLVHSLQGQRTSVLIYLHRLFTHVRHHKILKGKPLIDLLTCFYYKVFLSIWDVVWIMPEYMRTYKNTYAPSPHSHLNFTEHQSLKKVVYLANRVCCHLYFIMRLLSFKVWQSLPLHPHGCRAGGASMMCQFLSICRDARASRWMVQWSRLCLFSSC